MSGLSLGGEITAVEIEAYRGDYAGAISYCGALAANQLFDYFLGANVTAAALTKTVISYPMSLAAGQAYGPTYQSLVQGELPTLGIVRARAAPASPPTSRPSASCGLTLSRSSPSAPLPASTAPWPTGTLSASRP